MRHTRLLFAPASASPLELEESVTLPRSRTGVFPLVILLSLAFCVASLWAINTDVLGLFHDDALYNVLAKALSEGEGYRISSLPASPLQAKYPVIYPYLLSWIWRLNPSFPENIFLLKAINSGVLFVILLLSYRFYCKATERRGIDAFLYVALVGGNTFVFSSMKDTLSEPLFLGLTLLALLLYGHHGGQSSSSPMRVASLAGAIALAYLTRTVGASLLAAGILHFLLSRRYRELFLYLFIAVALISPWLLWQFTLVANTPKNPLFAYYLAYDHGSLAFFLAWSDPSQALQMVWSNLRYLSESLDRAFLLSALPELRFVIYPFVVWGFCHSFHRRTVFFHSFLLLYLLLILAWPWHPGRFSLPLIPLMLLFLFQGVRAVETAATAKALFPWTKQLVAVVVRLPLIILVTLNLIWLSLFLQADGHEIATHTLSGQRVAYRWEGFMETFAWVRTHTKEGDVLATAYDPMYHLYTNRKAIRPWLYKPETYFYPYGEAVPNVGSVEEIKKELPTLHVRYLIIDPLYGYVEEPAIVKLLDELRRSYPTPPQLVFSSSDGLHKVYALP